MEAMKVRTVALALALCCGPAAGWIAAQPAKHASPILKPAKIKKPKNSVNKRNQNSFQKNHNIKPRKPVKHPAHPKVKHPTASHAKPPKAPKHRA